MLTVLQVGGNGCRWVVRRSDGELVFGQRPEFSKVLEAGPAKGAPLSAYPYSTGPCGLARVPLGCHQAGVVAALS